MPNPARHPALAVPTPIVSRDSDFYTWAMATAEAIRAGRTECVDWESIAEEIEDMDESCFPPLSPWTPAQILDEGHWPEDA